jgi:hypothetical protein
MSDNYQPGVNALKLNIFRTNVFERCTEILDDPYAYKLLKQLAMKTLPQIDELTEWPEGLKRKEIDR